MEQIPSYDLLQAIDPTKIKVPISDRFAKLTLSSNKKQQQKSDKPKQDEELKRHLEKRNSVTRNISKQFDDENNKLELVKNPLLRSESSKETENNSAMTAEEEEKEELELTMEPLEVSQDDDNPTQMGDVVEIISQQLASMTVESKPVSLSSGSTCNLSEYTEFVSTESQRSSTSNLNNIHIVHDIPINVNEAVKQDAISFNLTCLTVDNSEKMYEMTDDEDVQNDVQEDVDEEEEEEEEEDDEEEEDKEEVITISDTSESHHEPELDIMATSSLPSTSLTSENLILPSLIDDKAERVAAFLRDVSIERRLFEQGHLAYNDTVDQLLDNREIDEINKNLSKSKQIAAADTESMTQDIDEEVIPKSVIDRKKRIQSLEKSIKNELPQSNKALNNNSHKSVQLEVEANNVHRLANDETQDNSIHTNTDDDDEVETTFKNILIIKTPVQNVDPTTPKTAKKDTYRMVGDETVNNTEYSLSKETPKMHSNLNNSHLQNENNFRKSPSRDVPKNSRRLINDETVSNSFMTDIGAAVLQSQDLKTPEKASKSMDEDGVTNFSISLQSTPHSSDDSRQNQQSFASVINSSPEINVTAPEHSITILETDEESMEHKSSKNESSNDNKLSNSFHREDSSDDSDYDQQMSQIQMSMGKINISAKINIKIHISNKTSTETSEDERNDDNQKNQGDDGSSKQSNKLIDKQLSYNDRSMTNDNDESNECNNLSAKSDFQEKPCNQLQLKYDAKDAKSAQNVSNSEEMLEDEKFLTEAEKLLTQLYGKSWQTPDVLRTLQRSSKSSEKRSNKSNISARKNIDIKSSAEKNSNAKNKVEEGVLDDFTIFRRNIVKTNLDSTRLSTPKTALQNKEISTERRNLRNAVTQKKKTATKLMTKSERKYQVPSVAKVEINKRRVNNNRWRQLIDKDLNSEGDNASDDDDADESWSKNASDLEQDNSDFENSPKPKTRRRNNAIKRQGRSDKSDYLTQKLNKSKDGEIVYLDLSKDEVEVQEEVPDSPPANHDVTFASRLQDILKTARHEDKPKLPSSITKTKRKLFTLNFGDDEFQAAAATEDETKVKTSTSNANDEREILEDKENCPFDSIGRPKLLNVINKKLESIKTGIPIFQLTPSPKKKTTAVNSISKNDKILNGSEVSSTPKSKTAVDSLFKTPLTVKSKGPAYTFKNLNQTPDYKYSFLKSFDVTVSKALCHPDALYFRENYRTKKEELSKILYDLYNEKLFTNKLIVPITWNKKLSNTAGRCLNKKKMGTRSSVIELSHKVLTSADRLRCTLIHELCHAATWIFNGEGGHGSTWKEWARKANDTFPELPKIGVCHQYDIEYKYTYKCTLCAAKSHAHSKSKKVENIRCSYCHGAIEVFLNKKDKDGNIMPTPVKEPTGFAKFVQDNYKKFKRDDLKHADVMKLLSSEFASIKISSN